VESGRAGPAMITGTAVVRPEPKPGLVAPQKDDAKEGEGRRTRSTQEEAEDPF
jgi:hypothetical protein